MLAKMLKCLSLARHRQSHWQPDRNWNRSPHPQPQRRRLCSNHFGCQPTSSPAANAILLYFIYILLFKFSAGSPHCRIVDFVWASINVFRLSVAVRLPFCTVYPFIMLLDEAYVCSCQWHFVESFAPLCEKLDTWSVIISLIGINRLVNGVLVAHTTLVALMT